MSEESRKELLLALRPQYLNAALGEKKRLLDGFVAATGYNRKHAINLLRKGTQTIRTRQRYKKYDDEVVEALIIVWKAANRICSKRLIPFLPIFISSLEKFGHLTLPPPVKEKLLSLSAATADRLLKHEKRKLGRSKSTTRPGHLIKKQIPIRTFADWNDVLPGFFEADLVAHCGEVTKGQFLNTLTMTDIATGWTELGALLMRSGTDVLAAVCEIKDMLPFPMLGFDTDNGGEFINHDVLDWCSKNEVTFTRSREYRKNDQAHVEEKNGSIVRRLVGYDRYEGIESWQILCTLYRISRLYVNFFQPCLKLSSKNRDGARVRKQYEKAQTPYQRVLSSNSIAEDMKASLRELFETLDPVLLLNEMERMQTELWATATTNNMPKLRSLAAPNQALAEVSSSLTPFASTSQGPKMNRRKITTPQDKPVAETVVVNSPAQRTSLPEAWTYACEKLRSDPGLTGKQILDLISTRYPGSFGSKDLNAINTRVCRWRKANSITRDSLNLTSWRRSPLNGVWPEVCEELEKNSILTAAEVLSLLSQRYPGRFKPTHLSSVKDKLKRWRANRAKQRTAGLMPIKI